MNLVGKIVATIALLLTAGVCAMAEEPHGLRGDLTEGKVAEVMVEFGDVKYSDTVTRTITFKNTTNTPIALLDYEATCRCVWLDLPKRAIGVGEEGVVTITYDSRGEWGSVGNYLSIETSNKSVKVAIWMSAEIVR